MPIKDVKPKFMTISDYLGPFLDDNRIRIFPMAPYGSFYCQTKKKPARGTIAFPNDNSLGDLNDLRFLREWDFIVIAIPKEVTDEYRKRKERDINAN